MYTKISEIMRDNMLELKKLAYLGCLFVLFSLFFSFQLHAGLPKGCEIEDVKTKTLQFKGQDNVLIYIQSVHAEDVYLANQDMQLTTKLKPLQWSVLLPKMNQELAFSCVESKPGAEQRVSCMGLIKVCRLSNVEFVEGYEKMQWLVSNESLENSYDILAVKHIKVA